MAADRAAELTEAYRILSDDGRRGEYDRARGASACRRRRARPRRPTPRRSARRRRRSASRTSPNRGRHRTTVSEGARQPRRIRPQGHHQPPAQRDRGGRQRLRRTGGARVRHRMGAEEQILRARQGSASARPLRGAGGSRGRGRGMDSGRKDRRIRQRRNVRAADGVGAWHPRESSRWRSPSSAAGSAG